MVRFGWLFIYYNFSFFFANKSSSILQIDIFFTQFNESLHLQIMCVSAFSQQNTAGHFKHMDKKASASKYFFDKCLCKYSHRHTHVVVEKKMRCKIHMRRPMEFKFCGKRLTDADLTNPLYSNHKTL